MKKVHKVLSDLRIIYNILRSNGCDFQYCQLENTENSSKYFSLTILIKHEKSTSTICDQYMRLNFQNYIDYQYILGMHNYRIHKEKLPLLRKRSQSIPMYKYPQKHSDLIL